MLIQEPSYERFDNFPGISAYPIMHCSLGKLHSALARLHSALGRLHCALARLHCAQARLHCVREKGVREKCVRERCVREKITNTSLKKACASIQKKLNSDIVMVLDECPRKTLSYDTILDAVNLSTEWAKRSKKEFGRNKHKDLFGIVQGGLFNDLRLKSLKELTKIGFDGYAIGGLAVGDSQKEMFKVLDYIKNYMPVNKTRYLMGVGTHSDIL